MVAVAGRQRSLTPTLRVVYREADSGSPYEGISRLPEFGLPGPLRNAMK